jgi:hypothetical protein
MVEKFEIVKMRAQIMPKKNLKLEHYNTVQKYPFHVVFKINRFLGSKLNDFKPF